MEPNMQDLKFKDEVKKMEYEPMDETELSLVRWSLIIGVSLLAILFIISKYLVPSIH